VHGRSSVFFKRAQAIPQSETETATKLRAIFCHKTQLKLSRKRFLGYAARPERLLQLQLRDATVADGPICSILRQSGSLRIEFELAPKPMLTAEPALFVLGHDKSGLLRCASMPLPVRSARVEMFDDVTLQPLGVARYRGNAFAGRLNIPTDIFSPWHALFVKLERRSWFFDETGWLEVPPVRAQQMVDSEPEVAGESSFAIR
jgi:hypothetical protein